MKKTMFMAMFTVIMTTLSSYSQDSTKTLFHLSKISHIGFYVAPEFQYGQLKNEFTFFIGGSGMILLNNKFGIGMTMQHTADRSFSPVGISPLYLRSNFGGLKMEYIFKPNALVHLTIPLVIGGGSARIDSATYFNHRMPDLMPPNGQGRFDRRMNGNEYFVVQPGVQVETNLMRYFKLYAGANYRFAMPVGNSNVLPANTLQGFSMNVGLKIGLFDFPTNKLKCCKKD